MGEEVWAYIGRDETGKVVAVTSDTKDGRVRKDVSEFMRDGLTIERVPVEWVRKHLFTTDKYTP